MSILKMELTHISLLAKLYDGCRQKRSEPVKTWIDTARKDLEHEGKLAIYGLR